MKEEYKTVCDTCSGRTWYEKKQRCKRDIWSKLQPCGHVEELKEPKQCKGTLRAIDYSGLDPRFAHYYETGERIEVTYKWGEKERFYIGRSTGWKPIWLAIKYRNSSGGGGLLQDSVTSIQPLEIFRS